MNSNDVKLFHEHNFNVGSNELDDQIVRIKIVSSETPEFPRNSFVRIKNLDNGKVIYKIVRGVFSTTLGKNQYLLSYNSFKKLAISRQDRIDVRNANWFERNFLFYFNHSDPRIKHKVFRYFTLALVAMYPPEQLHVFIYRSSLAAIDLAA